MRKFIIADIHGHYDKLINCLKKVDFDYKNDQLIQLGDVVDRGPDSFLVVEELLKIKNLIAIRGNHDDTFRKSTLSGTNLLYDQGGRETMLSYQREYPECNNDPTKIPQEHWNFFHNTQINYYIDEYNNCYVHGGFNRHIDIHEQHFQNIYFWDRDLFLQAMSYESMKNKEYSFRMFSKFNKIFIGHTPVQHFGQTLPIRVCNILNLDTGSGKGGELFIYNLEEDSGYFSNNDNKFENIYGKV